MYARPLMSIVSLYRCKLYAVTKHTKPSPVLAAYHKGRPHTIIILVLPFVTVQDRDRDKRYLGPRSHVAIVVVQACDTAWHLAGCFQQEDRHIGRHCVHRASLGLLLLTPQALMLRQKNQNCPTHEPFIPCSQCSWRKQSLKQTWET